MKSFEGYLKRKLGDSYTLLAGGGTKSLSDFFTTTNVFGIGNHNLAKDLDCRYKTINSTYITTVTDSDGFRCYKVSGVTNNQGVTLTPDVTLKGNTWYCWSYMIKCDHATNFNFSKIGHYQVKNAASSINTDHDDTDRTYSCSSIPANEWTWVWVRFKTITTGSIFIYFLWYLDNYTYWFRDFKLEESYYPSRWSPCDEDYRSSIDTVRNSDKLGGTSKDGLLTSFGRTPNTDNLAITVGGTPLSVTLGDLAWKSTSNIVSSFGTKTGDITLLNGLTGNGAINLTMSENLLLASIVGLGSNAFTSTAYIKKAGDIVNGDLFFLGSTDDSPDIIWRYGNEREKARIWVDNTYSTAAGPNYRVYDTNGTLLFNGTLSLSTHTHDYVTSFGGLTGAITVRGSQLTNGSVNLSMSNKQLQASIVGLGDRAFDSTAYLPLTGGDLSGVLRFTLLGTGTYNKSWLWMALDVGMILEIARETDSASGNILPFYIRTRGGLGAPLYASGFHILGIDSDSYVLTAGGGYKSIESINTEHGHLLGMHNLVTGLDLRYIADGTSIGYYTGPITVSVFTDSDNIKCVKLVTGSGSGGRYWSHSGASNLKANTFYVWSYMIKTSVTVDFHYSSIGHYQVVNELSTNSDKTHEDTDRYYGVSSIPANTWTKVWVRFKTNNLSGSHFNFFCYWPPNGSTVYIRDFKLEEAKYPSGWIPNDEDFRTGLDTVAKADTLTNSRTFTIGSGSFAFNGSSNVSLTLALIGAQAAGTYLPDNSNWIPSNLSNAGLTRRFGYKFSTACMGWASNEQVMYVYTDGFFYLNEGQYLCLDTNNWSSYVGTSTNKVLYSVNSDYATSAYGVHTYGGDVYMGTPNSSSNDSGDIVWLYGNGNEKMRIWTSDTYSSAYGPNYRVYNSSGTCLYSGTLATSALIPTKSSWNYNDMYISSVSFSSNKLLVKKGDGTNVYNDYIPYSDSAGSIPFSGVLNFVLEGNRNYAKNLDFRYVTINTTSNGWTVKTMTDSDGIKCLHIYGGSSASGWYSYCTDSVLEKNQYYTWSYKIKVKNASNFGFSNIGHFLVGPDNGLHASTDVSYNVSSLSANVWTTVTCTFKVTSASLWFAFYIWYLTSGNEYWITDFKLEKGKYYTGWCSNDEDNCYRTNYYTTSDISKKTNISVLSEHIKKFTLRETNKEAYGVIALEVPEIFRNGKEGNMTVNYNSILSYYIGLLENKVSELSNTVRLLSEEISKLKNLIK